MTSETPKGAMTVNELAALLSRADQIGGVAFVPRWLERATWLLPRLAVVGALPSEPSGPVAFYPSGLHAQCRKCGNDHFELKWDAGSDGSTRYHAVCTKCADEWGVVGSHAPDLGATARLLDEAEGLLVNLRGEVPSDAEDVEPEDAALMIERLVAALRVPRPEGEPK